MKFNKSQQTAVQHKDGPMLVLAGPGSGKTAVITHRTYNLIQQHHVDASSILVITFTKAASEEMKERFLKLTKEEKVQVTFGTFHAIFFMILKHAYHFTSDNIITGEQRYQMMREIISNYQLEYKDESEFIEGLFGEISKVKNNRIDINYYYSAQCGEEIFRKIFYDYQQGLKRKRLVDFDDMLTYTYELFQERKDILAAWQRKYKYILIDEFQDINRIQYEIIRMLALPENNLFIVGDDDQSIYRFRGSVPEIMLNFEKDYPNAQRVLLDINYRCGTYILDTACNLISHNKERFEKELTPFQTDCTPVEYITFENRKDENLYLIHKISELEEQGIPLQEIAVLYRTNTQPRQLMEQLMEFQIPFKMREQIPNIYEHWIAKDIFTYMRIAGGARERKEFLQIMNRPKRYLGRDSLLEPIVQWERWRNFYQNQPWIAERIERLEYDIQMMQKMNPYAAINYIRKGIGYDAFLLEYAKYRSVNKEELFDIIDEIQSGAKGFAAYRQWERHIEEYTEQMEKLAKQKSQCTQAITLATLHSSKGLEFEAVFLLDVNEGIMPYKKSVLEKDIEEERRLFYVGMTRAKKKLSIYSVQSIYEKDAEISRFVEETKHKEQQ